LIGLLGEIFSYGTAGIFIAFLFVAVAAIVFPYRRKDLFAAAPSPSNRRIGGVPLITIVGVISFISSVIVIYALIKPVANGSFATVFFEGIVPTFIVGAVIYAIAYFVRKGEGINLSLLQKEIPPE